MLTTRVGFIKIWRSPQWKLFRHNRVANYLRTPSSRTCYQRNDIADEIFKELEVLGIPLNDCRGQGYDNW
ncbi:hypothetical protein PR048_023000 [Dryococelus australis]|uniref:Uncharacterized protein n=1 Tax=Dryococelus australis TaxID=614101 RepID=A0ABQ9GSY5_9NEOP|nr:hypothetical protein PR048_023000 [Dryococelus australis]